jgi:hypothetical protein
MWFFTRNLKGFREDLHVVYLLIGLQTTAGGHDGCRSAVNDPAG